VRPCSVFALSLLLGACAPAAEEGEARSGGDTTVFDITRNAYGLSARNLTFDERSTFLVGNSFFNDNWVTAPASTTSRDGLGPVFNARSCSGCHDRDGRGRPPEGDEEMLSMLLRVSIPGEGPQGGPAPVPGYGLQLQPRAIRDVSPEVRTRVAWETVEGAYADGEPYALRRPIIHIEEAAFGPLPDALLVSPRVAPPVYGLGLLEAIPEETLLALADPDDADGDGVSGRVNRVWDAARGEAVLGRFGWKANEPNLSQQNQGAFLGDIGVTSPLFPDPECADGQAACAAAPSGGEPELTPDIVAFVDFYVSTLAVPARRDVEDPSVLRGKALFLAAGCGGCHVPRLETGDHPIEALAHQTIRPFTDLLLHDMGEGLADGRPDFEASGTEWRTPPLWGIGLLPVVNGHTLLLHDGRARGFAEAVLWHGGEAEAARESFRAMSADERADLVRFLESL